MSLSLFNFISFQAPVETSNHGLSEQEVAVSPPAAPPRPNTASPSPHGRASITSSPPSRHDTPDVPDQNSNSVRDLENAMSKHLPKSTSESADMSISGAASNLLLKQFYAGRTGSLEAGQGEQPPFLRGGYTSLGPAQPVPLKPSSLYLDQYPDQSNLYTSHGSTSSFQLYNRGQSWYPGTWDTWPCAKETIKSKQTTFIKKPMWIVIYVVDVFYS